MLHARALDQLQGAAGDLVDGVMYFAHLAILDRGRSSTMTSHCGSRSHRIVG
jgi:hypothetical protein